MSQTHTCPDCHAQLPAETLLEDHKAAVERAIAAHGKALDELGAALEGGNPIAIANAQAAVELTTGQAHAAAPCAGVPRDELRPDVAPRPRPAERPTSPGPGPRGGFDVGGKPGVTYTREGGWRGQGQ